MGHVFYVPLLLNFNGVLLFFWHYKPFYCVVKRSVEILENILFPEMFRIGKINKKIGINY